MEALTLILSVRPIIPRKEAVRSSAEQVVEQYVAQLIEESDINAGKQLSSQLIALRENQSRSRR
jgi:hypothetical protein